MDLIPVTVWVVLTTHTWIHMDTVSVTLGSMATLVTRHRS